MNGILLVDKPAGWTSFDVCARLRRLYGEKRVGHSGTLDPMATGLLTVFLGRATRAVEFAEATEKTYEASLRLGEVTDTQDSTGTVLERRPVSVAQEELEAVLSRFQGALTQIPPMYSALKREGKPLYVLARQGKEIPRNPRPVTIFELRCHGQRDGDWLLTVRCSKGTYIRTLCHDIGQALGCGGVMSALRRIRAGAFSVDQAHSPEEIAAAVAEGQGEGLLLPLDSLFSGVEKLRLSPTQERVIRNGGAYSFHSPAGQSGGARNPSAVRYCLYGGNGEFLALAEARAGVMQPLKRFF